MKRIDWQTGTPKGRRHSGGVSGVRFERRLRLAQWPVLVLALAIAVTSPACGESSGTDEPRSTDPTQQPIVTTNGGGADVGAILAELAIHGFDFVESDAPVDLDETEALEALDDHYHVDKLTPEQPTVIQVELVAAPSRPHLTPGHELYVVYATGFERVEYGPAPLDDDSPPEEIVITQVAYLIDANTGDFVQATWWE